MPFDTEMQFPPFLYTGVLGLLEYESVELQCQGLAAPSVRSPPSLSLSLVHRPRRSPRLAHALDMRGCRGEGDQCQGSPTSYTRKLTVINRINTPHGSLKSVCGCGVGGRGCCNEDEISGSFQALMCTLKMCNFSLHLARFAKQKRWQVEGRIHCRVVTIQLSVEHWKVRLTTCWWSSMFFCANTVSVTFCILDVHWEVRFWGGGGWAGVEPLFLVRASDRQTVCPASCSSISRQGWGQPRGDPHGAQTRRNSQVPQKVVYSFSLSASVWECSDVIQMRRNFNIKQWLLFTMKTPWKSFFSNKTIS